MPEVWKGRSSINRQTIPRPRLAYYWIPVIAYGILIFYVSSLEIRIRQIPFPYYDKVFHLVEYGIFAWLWYRALRVSVGARHHRWVGPAVFAVSLLFAGLDEMYQSIIPFRASDFYDFLADALGAFLVMMILILKER